MKKTLKTVAFLIFAALLVYNYYPEQKLPENSVIDSLVVHKSKREMLAFSKGELVKVYKISLGGNPIGRKEFEGDKKTPEGVYFIDGKSDKSRYYKNLGISYPNKQDIEHAKSKSKSAGGDVKIHGIKNGLGAIGKLHRLFDWTLGCIAVTNGEMEELYNAVQIGAEIEIKP
ncbi:L,D-transpeptidase family protein [Cytophagaceae bacterium ABcell3]|nr:L,D-transpeptidase family protein [Cytophagaceae bacterium ABcell3]